MDGMPEFRHKANYIWESGLKIGLKFGKRNRKEISQSGLSQGSGPGQVRNDVEETRDDVAGVRDDVRETLNEDSSCHAELDSASSDRKPSEECHTTVEESADQISLPVIYFAFNSTVITDCESAKLQEIKKRMDANPEMKITVNGWCDTKGSKAVNDRISLKRAETVKIWLVSNGIAAERITVKGNGSDFNETDAAKARRAESVTIKCEEK